MIVLKKHWFMKYEDKIMNTDNLKIKRKLLNKNIINCKKVQ